MQFFSKQPTRGRRIELRNGGHIYVGALSLRVLDHWQTYRDALGALWETVRDVPIDSPAELDAFVRKVGIDLVAGALGWKVILLEILRDSNADREFDEEWLRANLTLPDLRRIAAAFIDENELRPALDRALAWVRSRAEAMLEVNHGR